MFDPCDLYTLPVWTTLVIKISWADIQNAVPKSKNETSSVLLFSSHMVILSKARNQVVLHSLSLRKPLCSLLERFPYSQCFSKSYFYPNYPCFAHYRYSFRTNVWAFSVPLPWPWLANKFWDTLKPFTGSFPRSLNISSYSLTWPFWLVNARVVQLLLLCYFSSELFVVWSNSIMPKFLYRKVLMREPWTLDSRIQGGIC